MKRLVVEIKEEHLRRGRQCSRNHCPISEALRDMGYGSWGDDSSIEVTYQGIKIKGRPMIKPTEKLWEFIRRFDRIEGPPAEPTTLVFEVPDTWKFPSEKDRIRYF